jgi:hypothetical protein
MAYFAKLGEGNVVEKVIAVTNETMLDEKGQESEAVGIAFCNSLEEGRWIQASFNRRIRRAFPCPGSVYLEKADGFQPPISPMVAKSEVFFDEKEWVWKQSINEETA